MPDTGEARIFVLPVGQATLIDNWDVLGLRATGSIDYRIDDVFVPEAFTHLATTEAPRRGGHLYYAGHHRPRHHVSLRHGPRHRPPHARRAGGQGAGRCRAAPARWPASERFHEQYAKAEGKYRAAKAFVSRRGATRARRSTPATPLTVRQHTLMRLALANIDLVVPRGQRVRLHRGRHHRAPCRHDAAAVPRHARGHAARHLGAAGHPQHRARAGRRGRGKEVALPRSRRLLSAASAHHNHKHKGPPRRRPFACYLCRPTSCTPRRDGRRAGSCTPTASGSPARWDCTSCCRRGSCSRSSGCRCRARR